MGLSLDHFEMRAVVTASERGRQQASNDAHIRHRHLAVILTVAHDGVDLIVEGRGHGGSVKSLEHGGG